MLKVYATNGTGGKKGGKGAKGSTKATNPIQRMTNAAVTMGRATVARLVNRSPKK